MCARLTVGERTCVCVRWCTSLLNPLVPRGRNAAITPLVKEEGGTENLGGNGERKMWGREEGREDRTQLTWPITANEVRNKQRER